jgi:hypothetical protein
MTLISARSDSELNQRSGRRCGLAVACMSVIAAIVGLTYIAVRAHQRTIAITEFRKFGQVDIVEGGPAWIRRAWAPLSTYLFDEVRFIWLSGSSVTDSVISKNIEFLPEVVAIDLGGPRITDAGIERLGMCSRLQTLILTSTNIGDQSLVTIGALPRIERLELGYTAITNDGIRNLTNLSRLKSLYLNGTQIDDGAIDNLAQLHSLEVLSVRRTKLSKAGVIRLKKLLPSVIFE